MNILFITWDAPQASYLESLFLPIFVDIASAGDIKFHVLQFSWAPDDVIVKRRDVCEKNGVTYTSVPVIRKPIALGSMITSVISSRRIRKAVKKYNIDTLLPRSTLPALSSLIALKGLNKKLIFDADGLPLDERVEFAGLASHSLVYRALRDIESQAVRRADVVLTRSKKAIAILQARAGAGTDVKKFHVVGNGRDKSLFSPGQPYDYGKARHSLKIAVDAPLIVYAGSLGPQYYPDKMLKLFSLIRQSRADAHFLVLTGTPKAMTRLIELSYNHLSASVTVMRVDANEVPWWIAAADLGLAFREPTFSMQAVAPIKLGEYLLCGVPVVATRDVGDSHYIDNQSGLLVDTCDVKTLEAVSEWFINHVLPRRNNFREHCRFVGVEHFSLESSVKAYREAFGSIQDKP